MLTALLVAASLELSMDAATCESLATVSLPNTRILLAASQPAGAFTPPGAAATAAPNPALARLPAFCWL